jgi:septal ring factor EnvC (AmiA/AmiB activator)
MAGGMVVLVGGGTILGMGAGLGVGYLAATMNAATALLSAAKFEVVLKEFILQGQWDQAKIQHILSAQRKSIQALEEELDRLKIAKDASKHRISELEKVIDILQTALERNQEAARQ